MTLVPKKLHWVFVVGWLTLGGAERQALYFASVLKRSHGARVTFVGLSNPGLVQEECRSLGFECHFWPVSLGNSRRKNLNAILQFGKRLRDLDPYYIAPYAMLPNLLCGIVWRFAGA